MLKNYFITAIRNLLRNKAYSFINIAGLSIGLASVMIITLYIKDEESFDRFHEKENRLYRITTESLTDSGTVEAVSGITGYNQGPRFAANVPEIEGFVRYSEGYMDLKTKNVVKSQRVCFTDSFFFKAFTFPLIAGDQERVLRQPYGIVISEDFARKELGSTDVVGQTMLFKYRAGFEPYVIEGVAKTAPRNSSLQFDVLAPIKVNISGENTDEDWMNTFLNTFVLLKPNASSIVAEKKSQLIYEKEAAAGIAFIKEKYGVTVRNKHRLQPFSAMHLDKELGAGNGLAESSDPMYSFILAGIGFFLLLVACINFINLTIARSARRAKEIGMRKVIGGSRNQLVLQFMGESLILTFAAFLLGLLIAKLTLPVFNSLANKSLAFSYLFDTRLVLGYVVLFLLTGVFAGLYPAFVLSSYQPVDTLYSRFVLSGKNRLQKFLVIFQFSLSAFLIISTLVISTQFRFLTTYPKGYDDRQIVDVNKRELTRDEVVLLRSELLKSPDVVKVAPKNQGSWSTSAKVNGETEISFNYTTIDAEYFPTLKIPVVSGRNFSPAFPSDSTRAVVVNESFVKAAGWKDPIGQEVNFWYNPGDRYRVIGVVKDYHYQALTTTIGPQVFTMKPANMFGMVYIKIRPGSERAALLHIQQVFRQLFPINPYSYKLMDEENRKQYESESRWKDIVRASAVLTIFISWIGLLGLSVLSTERRRKEIGIRKVLGATVSGIAARLSGDFLVLVSLAMIIAVPLAWIAANKWLENYPYHFTLNWQLFLIAGLIIEIIALLTVSFQAIKGARTNPVKSLKAE